jgi:hypothetical protein
VTHPWRSTIQRDRSLSPVDSAEHGPVEFGMLGREVDEEANRRSELVYIVEVAGVK